MLSAWVVDRREIQAELQKIGLVAQVLVNVKTAELLREFSLNDTLGPIFDPTGWMAISSNARKNEHVVQALAAFQKVILEEWPELKRESE